MFCVGELADQGAEHLVLEPKSGKFLGTVTDHEVLDLMALMDEIQDEVPRLDAERG